MIEEVTANTTKKAAELFRKLNQVFLSPGFLSNAADNEVNLYKKNTQSPMKTAARPNQNGTFNYAVFPPNIES